MGSSEAFAGDLAKKYQPKVGRSNAPCGSEQIDKANANRQSERLISAGGWRERAALARTRKNSVPSEIADSFLLWGAA
jgi:hypothetical protein